MQVREMMTRRVETARPDETIEDVARKMAELDVGALPVCEGRVIHGMVTDRDIVIRGLARGVDRTAPVREVMTEKVETVLHSDDFAAVHVRMSAAQIRRLPVVDDRGELVGIIALGDVAQSGDLDAVGRTLEEISEPASGQAA